VESAVAGNDSEAEAVDPARPRQTAPQRRSGSPALHRPRQLRGRAVASASEPLMKIHGNAPELALEALEWLESELDRQCAAARQTADAVDKALWQPLDPGTCRVRWWPGDGTPERVLPVFTFVSRFDFTLPEIMALVDRGVLSGPFANHLDARKATAAMRAILDKVTELAAGKPTPVYGPTIHEPVWISWSENDDGTLTKLVPHVSVSITVRIAAELPA
jgi:hypothetical protein